MASKPFRASTRNAHRRAAGSRLSAPRKPARSAPSTERGRAAGPGPERSAAKPLRPHAAPLAPGPLPAAPGPVLDPAGPAQTCGRPPGCRPRRGAAFAGKGRAGRGGAPRFSLPAGRRLRRAAKGPHRDRAPPLRPAGPGVARREVGGSSAARGSRQSGRCRRARWRGGGFSGRTLPAARGRGAASSAGPPSGVRSCRPGGAVRGFICASCRAALGRGAAGGGAAPRCCAGSVLVSFLSFDCFLQLLCSAFVHAHRISWKHVPPHTPCCALSVAGGYACTPIVHLPKRLLVPCIWREEVTD